MWTDPCGKPPRSLRNVFLDRVGPVATVGPVRQLLPEPVDPIDVVERHDSAARPRPSDRPWVACNMIASVDGATAMHGVSGPLGGDADHAVFHALRSTADVILAAAGTVRAEAYGPPRTTEERQAARRARGQRSRPRIAVVSGSLRLDLTSSLFGDPTERPIVITSESADPALRAAVGERAELLVVGGDRVDLTSALATLAHHGDLVLCEGGPSLIGQLAALDLVDEMCLTIAPTLIGGDSARVAVHPTVTPRPMRLAHLWEDDGSLFARYVRDDRSSGRTAP